MRKTIDDGRLTDNKGRTVDFKNTILIMTSNVGAETIQDYIQKAQAGDASADMNRCKTLVMEQLKATVRPEFLNRIDEIIMFSPLSKENVREILQLQIADLEKKLEALDLSLTLTDRMTGHLCEEGFDPAYGARPVKRVIQKDLTDHIASFILKGGVTKGANLTADYIEGNGTVIMSG